MGSVNVRSGKLYLDFRYRDQRCREQSNLPNTPANKKRLNKLLLQIEAEIRVNSFNYEQYFPNSPKVELFSKIDKEKRLRRIGPQMLFETFAQVWFDEKVV